MLVELRIILELTVDRFTVEGRRVRSLRCHNFDLCVCEEGECKHQESKDSKRDANDVSCLNGAGNVSVLPNDVGRLRSSLDLDLLITELVVFCHVRERLRTVGSPVSERSLVAFLGVECQEGSDWFRDPILLGWVCFELLKLLVDRWNFVKLA